MLIVNYPRLKSWACGDGYHRSPQFNLYEYCSYPSFIRTGRLTRPLLIICCITESPATLRRWLSAPFTSALTRTPTALWYNPRLILRVFPYGGLTIRSHVNASTCDVYRSSCELSNLIPNISHFDANFCRNFAYGICTKFWLFRFP